MNNFELNPLTGKYDVVDLTNSLKLSDLMSELPKNCIFLKGKTGCGGTTLALRSDEPYIILMPFISNVKNKELTENGAFIYNGDYTDLQNKPNKICATYESLETLLKAIDPSKWNLLVDEYHILCNHYQLRQDAFNCIRDNFKAFKSYCFMSATEPEQEFGFLKILNKVEINWIGFKVDMPVVNRTMSITNFLKSESFTIENDVRQNDQICKHNFIFFNSVKGIEKIVRDFNLTDYQVFMSEHNNNDSLIRGDIQNPNWKQYNFFTSTCFESVDIFCKNPKIWIIMNEKSVHTLISPSVFQQIVGRFRGNYSLDVTIVSEIGDIKVPFIDLEAFKSQIKAAKGLQIVADSMGESFSWMDYKPNFKYLTFKNGKIIPCVEAFFAEYNILKVIEVYKNYHFKNFYYKKEGQDEMRKNVNLTEKIADIEAFKDYKYYELIKDCIATIGLQNTLKCKSIKAIKNALIDPNLLPSGKIRERLGLTIGRWYSCKEIKARLQKEGIYGSANRIKEFYQIAENVNKINGITTRGYIIKGNRG